MREQKQHTDRTLKEVDGVTQKVAKLQVELEDQVATNANQSTINGQIVAQIKVKLDEIAGITLEIRRMEKLTEALTKKARYRRDVGELWGRCRRDVGEL